MKSIKLIALVLKVSSIFMVFSLMRAAVGVVPYFSGAYTDDPQFFSLGLVSLLIILIGFVLAYILWNFPVSVSKWFMPVSNDEAYPNVNLEIESLEIILFSAIGVYLFTTSIPDLAYNVLHYAIVKDFGADFYGSERAAFEPVLDIMYSCVNVLIGFFLTIFSGNLKKFLNKVRGRT